MAQKRSTPPQIKTVSTYLNSSKSNGTRSLPIEQITLPERQPRRYFNPESMEQLITSVKEHGILEPLLVRPVDNDCYQLIAGERRLRAAQANGLSDVPVVIHNFDDKQALQVSLMENLQREDLNPVEETEAVLELLSIALETSTDDVITTLNRIAHLRKTKQEVTGNVLRNLELIESVLAGIGRFSAESFRTSRLPLLNLPEDVLDVLRNGQIAYTKAQAIARIKDKRKRSKLLKEAIDKDLPLAEIRERIKSLKPSTTADPRQALKQRLTKIGKHISKSEAWKNEEKQRRIAELLDELEQLAID